MNPQAKLNRKPLTTSKDKKRRHFSNLRRKSWKILIASAKYYKKAAQLFPKTR